MSRIPTSLALWRDLRLVELSAATIVAVNNMSLKPGQEQFLAPISYGVAGTVSTRRPSWQRVVLDGDEVVGFVSANFDPEAPQDYFRSVLWRINVDADDQGRGVGRFAVEKLIEEARARGMSHVNVIYEAGEGGPRPSSSASASPRSARPNTARSSRRSASDPLRLPLHATRPPAIQTGGGASNSPPPSRPRRLVAVAVVDGLPPVGRFASSMLELLRTMLGPAGRDSATMAELTGCLVSHNESLRIFLRQHARRAMPLTRSSAMRNSDRILGDRHRMDIVEVSAPVGRHRPSRPRSARGFHPTRRFAAPREIGRIKVIRRSWVSLPDASGDLVEAASAGGLVACVSAARHRGWWLPEGIDERLHLRFAPHARSAAVAGVAHWTTAIAPTPATGLVESPEDALAHIAACLDV